MIQKFYAFCFILFSSLIVGGCGDKEPPKKALVLGTSADNPPYEFFNVEEDRVTGFDVDLARMIAESLGSFLTVKDMDFNGLIPSVSADRIDFAMASITPTEERRKSVDFSDIYFETNAGLVVKDTSLKTLANFNGKNIGTQLGSSHEAFLKDLQSKGAQFTIILRNKNNELIQELKSGRIDGAFMDERPAKEFAGGDATLTFYPVPESKITMAIAFKKGSLLVKKVNDILKKLKEQGKIDELKQKWLH